jgi:hypothetical protein
MAIGMAPKSTSLTRGGPVTGIGGVSVKMGAIGIGSTVANISPDPSVAKKHVA